MKDTKYVCFGDIDHTGMVSVSQIQTFLSCKKKWEYGYIENLKPRIDKTYLTIGKLCHVGMQYAMYNTWEYEHAKGMDGEVAWKFALVDGLNAIDGEWTNYMSITPMLDEEVPNMEQVLEDAQSVFAQAFEEFEPWKYEIMTVWHNKKEIPALELHFKVPCPPTKGLHGFIDAILKDKETGFIWCTDYKFRKSLSPDDEEAFNIQNAVYTYACSKMGIDITGTMTWQHLNTPAVQPKLNSDLKSVSRAKIKTTWTKYRQFCEEHGIDWSGYEEEMKEKLSGIEWCRPTYEYRNDITVNNMWEQSIRPAAKAIKSAYGKNANNFRSLYPWNCKMCQFQSLCQAELRDYDAVAIREREYPKR